MISKSHGFTQSAYTGLILDSRAFAIAIRGILYIAINLCNWYDGCNTWPNFATWYKPWNSQVKEDFTIRLLPGYSGDTYLNSSFSPGILLISCQSSGSIYFSTAKWSILHWCCIALFTPVLHLVINSISSWRPFITYVKPTIDSCSQKMVVF